MTLLEGSLLFPQCPALGMVASISCVHACIYVSDGFCKDE